jgi:hypothetical protein
MTKQTRVNNHTEFRYVQLYNSSLAVPSWMMVLFYWINSQANSKLQYIFQFPPQYAGTISTLTVTNITELNHLITTGPSISLVCAMVFVIMSLQPQLAKASSLSRIHDHTQLYIYIYIYILGSTPLDEWSERRRDLYLTAHNSHKSQKATTSARFETTIPEIERPQTHTLDGAATGIGMCCGCQS